MKTTLRHLFNYWLPPGQSDETVPLNRIVEAAVKINASCVAMLSGEEPDWEAIKRENEEWTKLTERVIRREGLIELTRLSEEMGEYT